MGSKAKSGLSAVRQFPESCLEPPNSYSAGDLTFESAVRDGRGHSEYHVAAVNDTPFTLKVLHSWRTTGAWTLDETVDSSLDAETGLYIAEIIAPVTKRYIKAVVEDASTGNSGLGANFELGLYFQPRASGPVRTSEDVGAGAPVSGNEQVQNVEYSGALGSLATVATPFRDCINYEGFSVSVYAERGTGDATLEITIDHSADGATGIRVVEHITAYLTAANSTFKLDRVYSATRRYYRVRLANPSANSIAVVDCVVIRKPVA